MRSDVAVSASVAFGTVVFSLLLGAATWVSISFVSLVGEQFEAAWHAMSIPGL